MPTLLSSARRRLSSPRGQRGEHRRWSARPGGELRLIACPARFPSTGRGGPDHPGLIPASLLELDRRDDEPWRHIRRSGRDWTVDVICVLLSAVVGAALASTATDQPAPSPFVLIVDGVFGVISCRLWLRRRFPVGVAVLTALLSIFSVATAVAATIAMFTVAVHRRTQTALAIGLLNVATAGLFFLVRPQNVRINGEPVAWWILTATTTAMLAAVAWGCCAGPPATGRVAPRTGPTRPRPSSGCLPTRPDRPNGPASPARCTTSSPTGCR